MIISFIKTGSRTASEWGDRYRLEYTFFTESGLPIATLVYCDFSARINFNETTYYIEKVPGGFWVDKFLIREEDSVVGEICRDSDFRLTLSGDRVYKFKYRYKSLYDRFLGEGVLQLESIEDVIVYQLYLGARFDSGYEGREGTGKIEVDFESLPTALFGVVLLELKDILNWK